MIHLDMGLLEIPGNIENCMLPFFLNRKRQGKVHEGIECNRDLYKSDKNKHTSVNTSSAYLLALRTNKGTLVLSLKKINDDTIVPHHVSLPRLLRQLYQL